MRRAVSASVQYAARTPAAVIPSIAAPAPVHEHSTAVTERPAGTSAAAARNASGRVTWPGLPSASAP